MTLLALVQKTIRKSGAKVDVPTTVVGATGLTELFVEWVVDAWKDIQLQRLGWYWRVVRSQSMAVTGAANEYAIPSTLESVNPLTVGIQSAPEDFSYLRYLHYEDFLRHKAATYSASERPLYFTFTPDNKIAFWPLPNASYTVKYDGVRKVDIMVVADSTEPLGLQAEYHDGIVWQAVMYYAQHFEDGSKFQEAVDRFAPYKKYFEARAMPEVSINTNALYSTYPLGR